MSLLKQDIIRKGQIDDNTVRVEFDISNDNEGKYKVEAI